MMRVFFFGGGAKCISTKDIHKAMSPVYGKK